MGDRQAIEIVCRYTLAAVAIVCVSIAWRCEPHESCGEDLAKAEANAARGHARANECTRWTP